MHWVKLEYVHSGDFDTVYLSPLPMCPSVYVKEQFSISDHIPDSTRAAMRDETVHSPTPGSATRPLTPGLSYPRRLSRQLTMPPTYEQAVPAYGLLLKVKKWKKVINIVGAGIGIFGDTLCARMFMRWIIALGMAIVGPTVPWLSFESLLLFWAVDICVFRFLAIRRWFWLFALRVLNSWPGGYSLVTASAIDFFLTFLLYLLSTIIKSLVLAAENGA